MALLAVVMCFTSCSKDDDIIKNEEGVVVNQKKLVQWGGDEYSIPYKLTYDAKGRLLSIGDWWNYKWINDLVISEHGGTYTIENNLLRSVDNEREKITFTYNFKDQLVRKESRDKNYDYTSIVDYVWANDKIIKETETGIDNVMGSKDVIYKCTYTYSGKTCKSMIFNPIYTSGEAWSYLIIPHPELIGTPCLQLPDCKIESYGKDDKGTIEYTYKIDKDGYVESLTMISSNPEFHTYKWE